MFYQCVEYSSVVRAVHEDTRVGDMVLPKGSAVFIPTYHIHHHPDYYPEPEKFIPER